MQFNLNNIRTKEDLLHFFVDECGWEIVNRQYSFSELDENTKSHLCGDYTVLVKRNPIEIISIELKSDSKLEKESRSLIRKIISSKEFKDRLESSIFIFYSYSSKFEYLFFVKAKKVGKNLVIKKYTISPENRDRLRTVNEQLSKLKLDTNKINLPSYLFEIIEEVFSIEAVTEKFFKEYVDLFRKIKDNLAKQKLDSEIENKEEKLRNFTHLILNRLMFLYFVQKKGCFNNDKRFLINFWNDYKEVQNEKTSFHKDWLNVLFFEALSLPSFQYNSREYLKKWNQVLMEAPYLNGGLFQKEELDLIGWVIPDGLFDDIFDFFESYNFTVEEFTPFDIEIAVDPEMLGNIYEHLVNIEEIEKEGKEAGIFYTPKTEIELMLRRSLVEFLFNKTKISKEKIYQFIFPEENNEIINPFSREEAHLVLKELDNVFIVDPACGSGHYLVTAVNILYQLKEILWRLLNIAYNSRYEEKKKIIEKNIYGNDIKEWAINIAKLRLWLDLFIDIPDDVLKSQTQPLLPNLKFKLRCGDSLIQRIGHELISLRKISQLNKEESLLNTIKENKIKVYRNEIDAKQVISQEKDFLLRNIKRQKIQLLQAIQKLNTKQNTFWSVKQTDNNSDNFKERKQKQSDLEALEKFEKYIKESLNKNKEIPMIWDLSFAEVFHLKGGFDIVIANPPYVRQENIEDLTGFYSKKDYKEKLIEQLTKDWSYNFEGKIIKSPFPKQFDKKCDLYVYFYLKGLKLLNPEGILCYISSNSWLDVGYGRTLQEILLKRTPIIAIYDNLAKRSFKHADVNTIITLTKAPKEENFDREIQENEVRFVNFKRPYEEIMYSEIFIELEKNDNLKQFQEGKRRETDIYRLHLINQKELYEIGKNQNTGEYEGNKWGGKYLRAPEIYWAILEKGKEKIIHLGRIVKPRFDVKTGIVKFFYLSDKDLEKWKIEKEFLYPIIRSTKDCKTIILKRNQTRFKMFYCNKPKRELKNTNALKYIEWGEHQKRKNKTFWKDVSSVRRRKFWYFPDVKFYNLLWWVNIGDRYACFYNPEKIIAADNKFYGLEKKVEFDMEKFILLMNSTLTLFFVELSGQELTGALTFLHHTIESLERMFIVDLSKVDFKCYQNLKEKIFSREIKNIFTELGFDPNKPIREQEPNPLPDRKALDDIVFDALELTEEERKEVYWAVAELVQNRLKKAKSV